MEMRAIFKEEELSSGWVFFPYDPEKSDTLNSFFQYGEEPLEDNFYTIASFFVPMFYENITEDRDFVVLGQRQLTSELPVQVLEDTIRIRENLINVDETLSVIYQGVRYFIYKPEEGVIELYETI